MQTLDILPANNGVAAHLFNAYQAQPIAGGHQASADEQPAPQWLKASLQWMANNSALGWEDAGRLRKLLAAGITFGEALKLQQQLISTIQERELEMMGRSRQEIATTLCHNPEFFQNPSLGLELAQSYLSTITDEETSWAQVERARVRIDAEMDLFYRIRHLVEVALVDGEKLQSEMRQALRDPNATDADDCAMVGKLVDKMFASEGGPRTKWGVLDGSRQIHELVLDSKNPKVLLQAMAQAMKEYAAAAQPEAPTPTPPTSPAPRRAGAAAGTGFGSTSAAATAAAA